MASSQTPPRKKAAMMVRWKRSPPLLDDPPPATAATAQPKDMEDLFCLPKAQSTQSPDAANDLLFMQWIAASPVVLPFNADLLLEQACLLAEEKALQDRRVGQLPPKSNSSIRLGLYARYQIVSRPVASEDSVRMMAECLDGDSDSGSEDRDSKLIQLVLRGCWTECKFPEAADGGGCVVHVCFTKPPEATSSRVLTVDDENHLLVVHPDQLISPTKIADATGCARRVVLKNQFSSAAGSNGKDAVFGQIKHGLVQHALMAWRFDLAFLSDLVPQIVSQHSNELFACEVSEMEAREVLFTGINALRDWGERFTRGEGIAVEFSPGKWETIRLVRVLGVECEVTSGMFGMKGIMDGVCVVERQNGMRAVMPLEIKTGKPLLRSEHKAQTIMYCLMLADRFAANFEGGVEDGLLLQASFGAGEFKLIGVAVRHAELKELIRIRNSLTVGLPPVVPIHECQRCFQRDLCAFVDSPNNSEHFVRWREMMAREEEHQNRHRGFRPYQPSKFSVTNLTLRESNMGLLLFHSETALVNCGLQAEDYVTLSLQHAHYGVLWGAVQQVSSNTILVKCSDEKIQDFRTSPSVLWVVEKKTYSFANPIGNLVDLMLAEDGHKQKIRQLLTDPAATPQYWDSEFNPFIRNAKRPLLEHCLGNSMEHLRRDLARFGKSPPPAATLTRRVDLSGMTCDQVQAVASVLAAKDYVCILGAPGAGKTFLLSKLVRLLSTQLGKSVLIVSHTNTALDHLLMKIDSPHMVRVGVKSAVRPELHDRLLPAANCPTELLESHLHNPQLVVGVTCFAAGKHALFQRKRFDYCILDEASQVTELHMLASWFCGRVLVAVGDPLQLPPLVATQGNVESVLEVLARKRNAISVQLTTQFRMNEDLNFLANRLFYGDALQCGTEEVELQRLPLASSAWTNAREQWLVRALNPEQTICFCDTDGLGQDLELRCEGDEGGISNPTECQVVAQLVEQLHRWGELAVDQIGIISPYRAQLAELRLALTNVDVEIDTVDKYQGREKACIVVSLVRSNTNRQVGSLLADYRRLNVAFTRARCKLIVIGSKSTLVHNPRLSEFINVVQDRDWLIRVEKL
ncbi:hypothetical protein BASA81_001215 [Batrachochytrium salamandrivorans]|nr:hypothetical protein BASA81_001215 [Batrachochytrium salamandrivorans]